MLTFKKLEWDNCFSYADNNEIIFTTNPLTQLIGSNGAGKTSISLLLQEILYGKNIKNIKKQDISNNKTDKVGYSIKLFFNKDGVDYSIHLDRKSSLKLKLLKNDEDISSHSSLQTYKSIADIIGIEDFKLFCQLIYQHSTDSLDFLTATDTNRKKFLINLLQLERYIELHEHFKSLEQSAKREVDNISGSVSTIEAWIRNHSDIELIKKPVSEVPELNKENIYELSKVEENIKNINAINKKIIQNNEYKKQLNSLNPTYYLNSAPAGPKHTSNELQTEVKLLEQKLSSIQVTINKLNKAEGKCPTCLQEVVQKTKQEMLEFAYNDRNNYKEELGQLVTELENTKELEREIAKYNNEKNQFEKLSQLIDNKLENKTLDLNELKQKAVELEKIIKDEKDTINAIINTNTINEKHNSKIDVIKEQLDKMKEDLSTKSTKLLEKEIHQDILALLKKVFSTNGLVSYKIESSIKELEKEINYYLSELTYFQIYFKLDGEKLNIEVVDDENNITNIHNLSSGEKARVNIATILAIRKILSSLTSTKINLLFLDEVIGVIDAEGKERLAEILLKENLNTFIVSHDWNHPLVPKVNIIKENNISRIEYE